MIFGPGRESATPGAVVGTLWHMASTQLVTFDPCLADGISIWAAGGLIWRIGEAGRVELAVCYRPHREDWSFPKGKLEPGESFEEASEREVFEETGFRCHRGSYVGFITYIDRKDRPKVVAYWLMQVASGEFVANEEVAELRWVNVDEATALVTYDRDRDVIQMFSLMDEVKDRL